MHVQFVLIQQLFFPLGWYTEETQRAGTAVDRSVDSQLLTIKTPSHYYFDNVSFYPSPIHFPQP